MNKKALSKVVLIVLIVVIVVVIVAAWLMLKGEEEIIQDVTLPAVCTGVNLEVTKIVNSVIDIEDTITVKRNAGAPEIEGVTALVYVNGEMVMEGTTSLGETNQEAIRVGAVGGVQEGDVVKIVAQLPDKTTCGETEVTVPAYSVTETAP